MSMKITPEHYAHLLDALRRRMTTITPEQLRTYFEHLAHDPQVADPHKRLRWDLLWSSGLTAWVCDTLYPYLNDDHIDTALRRAIMELTAVASEENDELFGGPDSFDN